MVFGLLWQHAMVYFYCVIINIVFVWQNKFFSVNEIKIADFHMSVVE